MSHIHYDNEIKDLELQIKDIEKHIDFLKLEHRGGSKYIMVEIMENGLLSDTGTLSKAIAFEENKIHAINSEIQMLLDKKTKTIEFWNKSNTSKHTITSTYNKH